MALTLEPPLGNFSLAGGVAVPIVAGDQLEIAGRVGRAVDAERRRVVRRLTCDSFIERNKAAARNQTYCMAKARGQKPKPKLDAQGKGGGEHAAAKKAGRMSSDARSASIPSSAPDGAAAAGCACPSKPSGFSARSGSRDCR